MQTTTQLEQTRLMFLSGMFDETVRLLLDAQNYFSVYGPDDQQKATPVEKLVYTSEMSRITLRLSSVMAWLLARRAEYSGEITREQAVNQFRLAFTDVCLQELPEMQYVLPQAMCDLLGKSLELYRRASRLDNLIASEAPPATLH